MAIFFLLENVGGEKFSCENECLHKVFRTKHSLFSKKASPPTDSLITKRSFSVNLWAHLLSRDQRVPKDSVDGEENRPNKISFSLIHDYRSLIQALRPTPITVSILNDQPTVIEEKADQD